MSLNFAHFDVHVKYKNRPQNAGVIIENKVVRFYLSILFFVDLLHNNLIHKRYLIIIVVIGPRTS